MLDLSPAKLLIIVIVAVILLGPDKLPQVARQVGSAVRKLREFQRRVDEEVRQNIPDLPSSGEIARYARSPMTLINRWADDLVEDPGATAEPDSDQADWPADPAAGPAVPIAGAGEPTEPTEGTGDPVAGAGGPMAGAGKSSAEAGEPMAGAGEPAEHATNGRSPSAPARYRPPTVPDDPSLN